MKTYVQLLLALMFSALYQTASALDVGISYTVFATPDQPYLEVNLEIAAQSVNYHHSDSTHLQAGVEVLMLIKQGDAVVKFEKYALNSPQVIFPQPLLDVKRFGLAPGNYTLEVSCTDLNDLKNISTNQFLITVAIPAEAAYLTDVQLLRSYRQDDSNNPFVKNGYFLEPQPFAFYDRTAVRLVFYAEVYHSDKISASGEYLVRYYIERDRDSGGGTTLISVGNQRKKPSSIDAVLVQMDISKLESGNYSLTVELRDGANNLVTSRKVSFQRSNPLLHVDETALTDSMVSRQFVQQLKPETLLYTLKALAALAAGDENEMLKNIILNEEPKAMRFYIFRYFLRQDANNPELAYQKFMETAVAIDKQFFSGFRRGFETDRGRTFLRYGRPDDLVHVEDDPSAPPYEIWIYYNFPKTNQKNVKFLFYNPSLAGEDFVMLHSTARGEISNPKWERVLYGRNAGEQYEGDYHDSEHMKSNLGRNARAYFDDF